MSSGNFIIGKDLSLEGFNKYIKPNLEKYKAEITDFLVYNKDNNEHILVSLIGNDAPSALEKVVKISLEEACPIIEKDSQENSDSCKAWPFQIRDYPNQWLFKTIGLYQDNQTSSKVFQNLAVKYSLINLEDQLEKTNESLSDFGEKFKEFGNQ